MLVSVIIPTYNRASLVVEAVDSVLAQSFRNLELIVIDDGSTDETGVRLAAYGDRLRYNRQERSGVSAARNRGLALACGEWVAFLDSDDLWQPKKLEVQVNFFVKNPGAEICQTEEILDPRRPPGQSPTETCQTLGGYLRAFPGIVSGQPLGGHAPQKSFFSGGDLRSPAPGLRRL